MWNFKCYFIIKLSKAVAVVRLHANAYELLLWSDCSKLGENKILSYKEITVNFYQPTTCYAMSYLFFHGPNWPGLTRYINITTYNEPKVNVAEVHQGAITLHADAWAYWNRSWMSWREIPGRNLFTQILVMVPSHCAGLCGYGDLSSIVNDMNFVE